MPTIYNNKNPGLPIALANGFPVLLDDMLEIQLECFLKYLWDYTDVPNTARVLPPRTINPRTRIQHFKNTISSVYARLNCRHILQTSDLIASKWNRSNLGFHHVPNLSSGCKSLVALYDKTNGQPIITIPRSNLTYDLAIQPKLKLIKESMPKKNKKLDDKREIISLIDYDEDSDDDVIFIPNPEDTKDSKSSMKTSVYDKQKNLEEFLSTQNTQLILLPNPIAMQNNFTLCNEDVCLPKIEYSMSLQSYESYDSNISYYISDSDSESNSPLQDPLALDEKDESIVLLDSESDSSNEPKVLKSPAKKKSKVKRRLDNIRFFREITPPKTIGDQASSSASRQQLVIRESIIPLNQTYSQIKHAKELRRKAVNKSKEKTKISKLETESKKETCEKIKSQRLETESKKEKCEQIKSQRLETESKKETCEKIKSQRLETESKKEKCEQIKSQRVQFANALGLNEISDSFDDLIILPEANKRDFVKFHRLPLTMVPYLVSKDLVTEKSLIPGPPGQNSTCTATSNIDLSRRRSGRTCCLSGKIRSMNLKKARNYIFPKKTYRTRTPVPFPIKKRIPGMPGPSPFPKPNKVSKTSQKTKPQLTCSKKVTNASQETKPQLTCSKKVTNASQETKPQLTCSKKVTNGERVMQKVASSTQKDNGCHNKGETAAAQKAVPSHKENVFSKKGETVAQRAAPSRKVNGPSNISETMVQKAAPFSQKVKGPSTKGGSMRQKETPSSHKENGPSNIGLDIKVPQGVTLKECRVTIQKLNPFIVRYYSKK